MSGTDSRKDSHGSDDRDSGEGTSTDAGVVDSKEWKFSSRGLIISNTQLDRIGAIAELMNIPGSSVEMDKKIEMTSGIVAISQMFGGGWEVFLISDDDEDLASILINYEKRTIGFGEDPDNVNVDDMMRFLEICLRDVFQGADRE